MSNRSVRRNTGTRKPLKTIFAIVEGTSEKIYLERIRRLNSSISIKIKVTNQKKATDIVNECHKLSLGEGLLPTDVLIAVFDCDAISEKDMESAIALARKYKIILAVSNLCFEYWLLLHFEEPPLRLDTEDLYEEELSKLLGKKYNKSSGLGDKITFNTTESAVKNARKRLPSGSPLDCYYTQNTTCMHNVMDIVLNEK